MAEGRRSLGVRPRPLGGGVLAVAVLLSPSTATAEEALLRLEARSPLPAHLSEFDDLRPRVTLRVPGQDLLESMPGDVGRYDFVRECFDVRFRDVQAGVQYELRVDTAYFSVRRSAEPAAPSPRPGFTGPVEFEARQGRAVLVPRQGSFTMEPLLARVELRAQPGSFFTLLSRVRGVPYSPGGLEEVGPAVSARDPRVSFQFWRRVPGYLVLRKDPTEGEYGETEELRLQPIGEAECQVFASPPPRGEECRPGQGRPRPFEQITVLRRNE